MRVFVLMVIVWAEEDSLMVQLRLDAATTQPERKIAFSEGFEADGAMTLMYAQMAVIRSTSLAFLGSGRLRGSARSRLT